MAGFVYEVICFDSLFVFLICYAHLVNFFGFVVIYGFFAVVFFAVVFFAAVFFAAGFFAAGFFAAAFFAVVFFFAVAMAPSLMVKN